MGVSAFATHWLAVLEPGLGRRDQQFFELAATLIPIFFLAGTIGGVAQTLKPGAKPSHLGVAVALLAFVVLEIFAELVSIEALVSGLTRDFDRYLVLAALVIGMWAAGFGLLWPWVNSLYRNRLMRDSAMGLIVVVLAGLLASGFGIFRVFDAVFDVTQEERALKAVEAKTERQKEEKKKWKRLIRGSNEFLRLNIRLARICRSAPQGGWTIDEHLSLRLVKLELWEFIRKNQWQKVLLPKERGSLDWIKGSC